MKDYISVIIPAYNAEAYLERCINSILSQTHRRLEIIAVNDGSADGTRELLEALAAQDSRVKPVHQENTGAAGARLTGIQKAKGDYLTFVDSDDYLEPAMLETLLSMMQDDVQIAACHSRIVSENGTPSAPTDDDTVCRYDLCGVMQNLYSENLWSVWGKLYRRELFEENTLMVKDLHVGEDLLLVYSLYRRCGTLAVTHKKLYNYFRHSTSVMAGDLTAVHIRDSMQAYRLIAEDMTPDTDAYICHIQNLLSNDFGFLNSIILRGTCRECYREIRQEILQYAGYAFKKTGNTVLNSRHRLGVILLKVCPPLFDVMIKIKG